MRHKLSSRKLWAALAGLIAGLAVVFGLDDNIVSTVSGAVLSVASVVMYIAAEGRIDAAAVGTAAQQVQQAVDAVRAEEE